MDYSKHESWYLLIGTNPYYLPSLNIQNDNKKIEEDIARLCDKYSINSELLNIEFHNCVKEQSNFSLYYKAMLPYEYRVQNINRIYYKEFMSNNVLIPEKNIILRGL